MRRHKQRRTAARVRWLAASLVLALGVMRGPHIRADERTWNVPGDEAELEAACEHVPGLQTLARNGYVGIECGYQAI
ncbi:MAG: hypothetical protein ABW321_34140, partial [Polyangiales bacterium]